MAPAGSAARTRSSSWAPASATRCRRTVATSQWWTSAASVGWMVMEFQDAVQHRRMVRNFDGRPIERDIVERILANGLRAPSAGFTQGWAFLVLEGDEETGRF